MSEWMKVNGLTLHAAKPYDQDALDRLAPLANAKVPLFRVSGGADEKVPFEEHTADFARRYEKLWWHHQGDRQAGRLKFQRRLSNSLSTIRRDDE